LVEISEVVVVVKVVTNA